MCCGTALPPHIYTENFLKQTSVEALLSCDFGTDRFCYVQGTMLSLNVKAGNGVQGPYRVTLPVPAVYYLLGVNVIF